MKSSTQKTLSLWVLTAGHCYWLLLTAGHWVSANCVWGRRLVTLVGNSDSLSSANCVWGRRLVTLVANSDSLSSTNCVWGRMLVTLVANSDSLSSTNCVWGRMLVTLVANSDSLSSTNGKISVIICLWGREELIPNCKWSLDKVVVNFKLVLLP